jgi:hypothetical protein
LWLDSAAKIINGIGIFRVPAAGEDQDQ